MNHSDPTALRLLALAVIKNNPIAVARHLKKGTDPNGFCRSRQIFPLAMAVRIWSSRIRSDEEREAAGTIVDMLLDAGASPVAFDGSHTPIIGSLGRVCAHPRCLEIALEGARDWAKALQEKEGLFSRDRDGAVSFLQNLHNDTEEHRRIREHLLDLGLKGDTWWQAAMVCQKPTLMEFVIKHRDRIPGGIPTLDWMVGFLEKDKSGAIQHAHGVLVWLKHLDGPEQTQALLGTSTQRGILAATVEQRSGVCDPTWEFALKQPGVIDAMQERGLLRGFLTLSMLGHANNARVLLREAVRRKVDVGTITIQDAQVIKVPVRSWENPYIKKNKPTPEASLLECHLTRGGGDASVTLLRALVKAGVAPDYPALVALCRKMTTEAQGRKLSRLLEEWTGPDGVDPAPKGEVPVWEHIHEWNGDIGLLKESIQNRFLQKEMEKSLPEADETATVRRPSMRF